MTQLMESPLLIIALGLMLLIMLGSGWLKTGHPGLVYAMIGTAVVFGALLTAERLIKTDKEQVKDTLRQIARDVENNDLDAVLGHIHSQARAIRLRAQNEMPLYRFKDVTITTIRRAEVDPESWPPTAVVEFVVRVDLTFRSNPDHRDRFFRFVIVRFRKEEGRWKVWDYEHYEFRRAFQRRPAAAIDRCLEGANRRSVEHDFARGRWHGRLASTGDARRQFDGTARELRYSNDSVPC